MTMTKSVACSTRKRQNDAIAIAIPYLPIEIYLKIFSSLPAKILFDCCRPVCKAWRDIIQNPNFIKEHLKISKTNISFHNRIPEIDFLDSNDGITLFSKSKNHTVIGNNHHLYVANPVTKQISKLPKDPSCEEYYNCCLAKIPRTSMYKVVCPCEEHGDYFFRVLTLGVDSAWRKIESTITRRSFGTHRKYPLICDNGVVYWARGTTKEISILVIDLGDESTHVIRTLPSGLFYGILKMGEDLSCTVRLPNTNNLKVYVLKNVREPKWVNVLNIDWSSELGRLRGECFWMKTWLDNGHKLIFQTMKGNTTTFWSYDLRTRQRTKIHEHELCSCMFVTHTNSLISWNKLVVPDEDFLLRLFDFYHH